MARIFISHSSRDAEQAARILAWLREKGFEHAFLDFDKHGGIPPGAQWERTLYREIARAEAVILVLTANWLDSKWCFVEFAQARALGKAIFPVIESPAGATYVAPDIQHLDLVKDRKGGLERLARELTRIALNARGGFPWDSARPPFPGLLAFSEGDAAVYFGRDDDIRRLIERLNARRVQGGAKLVALLGASGSGKSSLMRAGVLPRLRRDPHNWIVLPPFRPQISPLDELAHAMTLALGANDSFPRVRTILASRNHDALRELARDLRTAGKSNEAQILIPVDQGEELFSAGQGANAEQFWQVLNALLGEGLPFLCLLTMRSDHLGRLQGVLSAATAFEEFSLRPMPLDRIRDIIEGPAGIAGIEVDDALVDATRKDAATDDALPLLAFVLRELYERHGGRGRFTLAEYESLADATAGLSPLESAVRRKADEVLGSAGASADELQALKDAFLSAMVRVNSEGEYARRPARLDALPPAAQRLIGLLAAARLLVVRQEGDVSLVEVVHEALLRKWPLLRGWLDEEREFLIGRERLAHDVHEWERAPINQKPEALLTGLKLNRGAAWLADKSKHLSGAERNFIVASIQRQQQIAYQRFRMRRTLQFASAVAIVLLLVTAVLALWQWRTAEAQRNEALQARARFLAEKSQAASEQGAFGKAALLALEGMLQPSGSFAPSFDPSVEAALTHAVVGRLTNDTWTGEHTADVTTVGFSPDSSLVLSASTDGTARLWKARSGDLVASLRGHYRRINQAVFSPDGRIVVTSSEDGTTRTFDAQTGAALMVFRGRQGSVVAMLISPDGRAGLEVSRDGTSRLWDFATGRQLRAIATPRPNGAAFSPDGRFVVVASDEGYALLIELASGNVRQLLHEGPVLHATFSQDGRTVATASRDKTVRIWNALRDEAPMVLRRHTGAVDKVVLSGDRALSSSSEDRTARLWNTRTGREIDVVRGIVIADFFASGKRIITTTIWDSVFVWDADTARPVAEVGVDRDRLVSFAVAGNGDMLATGTERGAIKIWNIPPALTLWGRELRQLACSQLPAHRRQLSLDDLRDANLIFREANDEEAIARPGPCDRR